MEVRRHKKFYAMLNGYRVMAEIYPKEKEMESRLLTKVMLVVALGVHRGRCTATTIVPGQRFIRLLRHFRWIKQQRKSQIRTKNAIPSR